MSTNKIHPKAAIPFLTVEFESWHVNGPILEDNSGIGNNRHPWPCNEFSLEVMGSLLVVVFKALPLGVVPSWIVVWDWVRGVEVTRLPTQGGVLRGASATLISQNALLIPMLSEHIRHPNDFDSPWNIYGSLGVYLFDPTSTDTTPPRLVTNFLFPEFRRLAAPTIIIEASPQGGVSQRPRVYSPVPQDRLVCLTMTLNSLEQGLRDFRESWMLYIPVHALLNPEGSKGHTGPQIVPWIVWAPHTSLVDMRNIGAYDRGNFNGQRGLRCWVGPRTEVDDTRGYRLVMLDFSQKRMRALRSGVKDSTVILCAPKNDVNPDMTSGTSRPHWSQAFFNNEDASPQLEYVRRVLKVEQVVQSSVVDDEYIVLHNFDLLYEGGRGIDMKVYTM